jgi:hypothetical protein
MLAIDVFQRIVDIIGDLAAVFFYEFNTVFSVFAVVEAFYGGDVSALLWLDGGLFEVTKAGEAELHHKSPQG